VSNKERMKVMNPQFLGNRLYRGQMKELHFSSRHRTVKTSTPSVPKSMGIHHHQ